MNYKNSNMNYKIIAAAILWFFISSNIAAQDKPNIVLVFMDNFGWGEIGAYGGGILRGAPTPNIDKLADTCRYSGSVCAKKVIN